MFPVFYFINNFLLDNFLLSGLHVLLHLHQLSFLTEPVSSSSNGQVGKPEVSRLQTRFAMFESELSRLPLRVRGLNTSKGTFWNGGGWRVSFGGLDFVLRGQGSPLEGFLQGSTKIRPGGSETYRNKTT